MLTSDDPLIDFLNKALYVSIIIFAIATYALFFHMLRLYGGG